MHYVYGGLHKYIKTNVCLIVDENHRIDMHSKQQEIKVLFYYAGSGAEPQRATSTGRSQLFSVCQC